MRNRVERLRIWLLVGAFVLMAVLAAFIGWARYLRGHYLAGLPARLGLNVVRETDGYTLTQAVQGRTMYRLHAAKAIEHVDGKIGMHDVSITVYGKKGDRSDRVYGDEFEYDKNAGVVRAKGVVHIDLESAEAAAGGAGSSGKLIHVTTSDLVYLQKFGVAATSAAIEFEAGGMTGHAVGADYSSDAGLLVLHSAVRMSGSRSGTGGGHAMAMTAATAQFDQRSQQVLLTGATYESEGRRASMQEATLDLRTNGTLSRIRAKGDVRLDAKGAVLTCERADIALTASSQPQTAVLKGAVRYVSEGPLRQAHGEADEATISFDTEKKPQPRHAVFAGSVHMGERTRTGESAAWSGRDLTAGKVQASLVPGGWAGAQVRDVEATGSPRLRVVSPAAAGGASTAEMAADDLKAHLVEGGAANKAPRVDTIVGRGHTLLRQVTADGGEQTVMADSLDAKLRPGSDTAKAAKRLGVSKATVGGTVGFESEKLGETLWSAVQQGHVVMMQRVPARAGAKGIAAGPKVEHAMAERAVYDGDLDRVTLSDGVQVSDAESVVWANQIVFDHATGDAHAVGGVKVSYAAIASPGSRASVDTVSGDPTHVVADRAELVHATGVATFFGRPARLWQGASQVQAPVIELSNAEKRLVARGEGTANRGQVETVLAGRGGSASAGVGAAGIGGRGCESSGVAKTGAGAVARAQGGGVTRIASGGLTYSGATREADFTGGFLAETEEGTIRANEGVAYLRQRNVGSGGGSATPAVDATASRPGDAAAVFSGDLDRVVATGGVEVDRPGLKATGKRLLYTASDGTALLTGDPRNLPRAVGPQGTTTGDALRFRTSCGGGGSVEVVGGAGQRVHTDATITDRKNGKGK